MQSSLTRFVKQSPHWAMALLAILLVSFYWLVWAEERYVSRATVVLESPQVATPEFSLSSLMGGGGGNTADLLLLREHLLSVDMLRLLDEQLGIRQHYSEHGDLFARLRDPNVPIEDLHRYYLRRVEVELDEYAGVLNIHVQGYTPEFAHSMASLLLEAGENHMNEMGHRLADEQARRSDDLRDDVIAQGQREGKDRPGDDPRAPARPRDRRRTTSAGRPLRRPHPRPVGRAVPVRRLAGPRGPRGRSPQRVGHPPAVGRPRG